MYTTWYTTTHNPPSTISTVVRIKEFQGLRSVSWIRSSSVCAPWAGAWEAWKSFAIVQEECMYGTVTPDSRQDVDCGVSSFGRADMQQHADVQYQVGQVPCCFLRPSASLGRV
jgi:hypothetical protein